MSRGPASRPRVLAVSDVYPWPSRDGYRLRFASVLEAIAQVGDLDLFVGAYEGEGDVGAPSASIGRYKVVEVPSEPVSVPLILRAVRTPLPRRILGRDWTGAQRELSRFAHTGYDLVWYSHADSYAGLGSPKFGPAVVDLDNLEDRTLRQMGRPPVMLPASVRSPHLPRRLDLRSLAKWSLDRLDIPLWSHLQRKIANEARTTVVCSALDRGRLQGGRTAVIPNGYVDPGPPTDPIPQPPTLLMVARFTYQPNLDGAAWFCRRVLPRLRQDVPNLSVRLVGRHDERLRQAVSGSAVTIVGEVEDVGDELRSARAVVVPLRSGSGTRIKVIEAFAYGVPVVTTELGCEGLDIEGGRHALVADDPTMFAENCRTILRDDEMCARLRVAGRDLFRDQYDWKRIQPQIASLVAQSIGHSGG